PGACGDPGNPRVGSGFGDRPGDSARSGAVRTASRLGNVWTAHLLAVQAGCRWRCEPGPLLARRGRAGVRTPGVEPGRRRAGAGDHGRRLVRYLDRPDPGGEIPGTVRIGRGPGGGLRALPTGGVAADVRRRRFTAG